MADTYYAGKLGKVTITVGSTPTEVPVKGWKATHSIQELDTTSTTDLGFYNPQGGIQKVEGSFDAEWDAAQSPTGMSGLGISAGSLLGAVELYVNNAGPHLDMTNAFVKSIEIDSTVDTVVKYTVNFVSKGSFTLPS